MLSFVLAPAFALLDTATPFRPSTCSLIGARRHARPALQFNFKLPESNDPPAAKSETPPTVRNPFAKLVEAFTPVEVDRDGNVVEATTDAEDERARQRIAAEAAKGDEMDAGEKLFNFFFGAPQEGEVAGLARTGGAPDTYPATKTEYANPVEGDSAEVQVLRPMLKNTNLEFLPLRLAYDSGKHGWSASAWHKRVDKTGPCLVVAKTTGGAFCGGYAPKGFAGYGENRGSIAAFLFTWLDGDTGNPVTKLQKIGGAGLATIDEPETGPRFGADGFTVRMTPGMEKIADSKLGPYYEAMPGGGRAIFAPGEGEKVQGSVATELTLLRTYVGVWPEGERIPYDGAIPFAIE